MASKIPETIYQHGISMLMVIQSVISDKVR